MNRITTGTAHFVSFEAAFRYYKTYGCTYGDVKRKIDDGEIFIGKPEAKEGETVFVNKEEGRYFVRP